MTPSESHEYIKSMIGRLLEAWCFERDIDLSPIGSWTLESKPDESGAEPDECYKLGDGAPGGKPDLVVEVIWTSGRLDKLEIYRRLGIAEAWIWRRGQLRVFVLAADGYEERERSALFPELDIPTLASFVEVRPMTQAVRAFRETLRPA